MSSNLSPLSLLCFVMHLRNPALMLLLKNDTNDRSKKYKENGKGRESDK